MKTRKEKADAPAELRKEQRRRLAHAKHTVLVCWRAMSIRPRRVSGGWSTQLAKINMKRQNLIHIVIGIVCIGLLPGAQAVVGPPDGGNTAGRQNRVPSASPFAVGAATHEAWADSQEAPPTQTSFMASWGNVAGAIGYLLDVSASDSFDDYVDGYHDLDVGNATEQVVTDLTPGTTYYYRVRPYTASNTAIGPGNYSEAMTATTVSATGLTSDVTATSPEGINLDVIGFRFSECGRHHECGS